MVKERYARLAKWDQQKCCPSCACGGGSLSRVEDIGYSREDVEHIPEEAVMNLGCGNPTAIASPEAGEIVLDLGAGAGADVFLAANRVGGTGRVIGVDMTKEMVDRARIIAKSHDYHNVEFRLGEIEKLPVESESVDVVISNCVINLSPDKSKVFQEAHRVLKPGGRLVVSDKVSERTLPDETKNDLDAWAGCIAGTLERQEYLNKIEEAGFKDVQVISSREFYVQGRESKAMVKLMSITVKAYKAARHNIAQNN